jgi:hypothetical protein
MTNLENPEELEKTSAEQTPDDNSERQEPTPYHDAAFNVFSYRLHKYKENDDIALFDEHRLSKEPLRIDIIVVKKNRNVELDPCWAKIFRKHNIIEYKSPFDKPPTLAVFNKLIGYANIYAAQENVKINDMTATLVCANPPKTLFKILEDEFDYKILQKDDGIYYIIQKGAAAEKNLAIQVVTQKSELLLQALDKKAWDETTTDKVMQFILTIGKENRDMFGYWFKAITPENIKNIFERTGGNMESEAVLMEIMESSGLSDYIMKKGIAIGILKTAKTMKDAGFSIDDIIKATNLSVDEILSL